MAALKTDPAPRGAKPDDSDASPLARVMREFGELVLGFETGLLRSLEDADAARTPGRPRWRREHVRREACRLALSELSTRYTRKQIRRSLHAAESHVKNVEELLHASTRSSEPDEHLGSIHNGHFRLYSSELFDMLGQPTDLRFGTLRFHANGAGPAPCSRDPDDEDEADQESERSAHLPWISIEMALNSSFFVADSMETLPLHAFRMPQFPSLQNRGILSRKPEDGGAYPEYDSWLLFTFLGNGCLKLEVPIEMCADVYGGPLVGRENEEVVFWGVFVEDEALA